MPLSPNNKRHYIDTNSDEAKRQARELIKLAEMFAKAGKKLQDYY